jgi:hypothetical protein
MRLKLLDAPIIKSVGEDKFALRATAVIDRRPESASFTPSGISQFLLKSTTP